MRGLGPEVRELAVAGFNVRTLDFKGNNYIGRSEVILDGQAVASYVSKPLDVVGMVR